MKIETCWKKVVWSEMDKGGQKDDILNRLYARCRDEVETAEYTRPDPRPIPPSHLIGDTLFGSARGRDRILQAASVAPITNRSFGMCQVHWTLIKTMVAEGLLVKVRPPQYAVHENSTHYVAAGDAGKTAAESMFEFTLLRFASDSRVQEITASMYVGGLLVYREINAALVYLYNQGLLNKADSTRCHAGRRRPRWYTATNFLFTLLQGYSQPEARSFSGRTTKDAYLNTDESAREHADTDADACTDTGACTDACTDTDDDFDIDNL